MPASVTDRSDPARFGLERLVAAVQDLSRARTLDRIMVIVRLAARELTGADGATFILRDGDLCHYAEENAVAPLWKGRRFPMGACISGWVMLNRQPAVIEDISRDERIPQDAYKPTFVKSLAMVPIRTADPVGAIGNYWAERRSPSCDEVALLQALADSTSVAMENVRVYGEIEQLLRDRTVELQQARDEVKTLRGLIPLCAWCRLQVCGSDGTWRSLEEYVRDHSEARISHGLCPDCLRKEMARRHR